MYFLLNWVIKFKLVWVMAESKLILVQLRVLKTLLSCCRPSFQMRTHNGIFVRLYLVTEFGFFSILFLSINKSLSEYHSPLTDHETSINKSIFSLLYYSSTQCSFLLFLQFHSQYCLTTSSDSKEHSIMFFVPCLICELFIRFPICG